MMQCKSLSLFGIFFMMTLPLFLLTARSSFQDDRANDTTSAYYLSYGRNINRYPISTTKFLNIDLVTPEGKDIFKDKSVSFYRDHPPLLTWSVALALKIKGFFAPSGSDLIAARMVSILASIGILLMALHICQKTLGTIPAIVAGFAILSCPVFLSHGLVVNFEPLCVFFILLGFMGNSPFFFIPALLTDWPAFFALPVYSFFELKYGNGIKGIFALSIGLFIGVGILFLYGYLTGNMNFPFTFIRGTASSEAGRYLNHGSELLQEAKAVLRMMIMLNFGPLNCLVLFIGSIRWLMNLRALNITQIIGVASVVVTFLNIVLFHSWAASHTFWSYYLLPAVAIAYADLATEKRFRVFVMFCLGVSFLYSANIYVKQLLIQSPGSSVEEKSPILLNPQPYPIFTDTRHAYFGHGYVARWYFDRPLEFVSSPLDSSVKELCSTQPCIWLGENIYIHLPKDQFDIYKVGHFGNVYLTTFSVKKK